MRIKLNVLAAILVVSGQGFAQNSIIKVGQQLPDLEINKILFDTRGKAKLSDFKGKLIILDFWSKSCSSCIDDMPKMDSLQKYFGNKIAILPVYTFIPKKYFNETFINSTDSFWRVTPKLSKTSLPTIVDNNFAQNFPERVAYQVWIDGNRVVRAIAHPEYVNKKEIQKMLDGTYPNWESEIKENSWGKPVSGYLSGVEFTGLKGKNYSFFSPYISGIDSHPDISRTDSSSFAYFKNCNILAFYRPYLISNDVYPTNISLETNDSTRYFVNGYLNEWLRNHSFCYELKLNRKVDQKTLADYIRQDANKYFGLNARLENRNVSCLVLKKVRPSVSVPLKDYEAKISIQEFYQQIRYEQGMMWQKIGKGMTLLTDVNPKLTAELKYPWSLNFADLMAVRKVLQSQGFDLVKEKRMQKMLVISEIN